LAHWSAFKSSHSLPSRKSRGDTSQLCRSYREIPAMPVKIKLALSLAVVLVAAIAAYYQHVLGHERIQYVVAFLGFFMIFAMWLFPEVKREESAGGVRRDTVN
jgi:uncharacterized membrane protein YbaN (DUF454 family)